VSQLIKQLKKLFIVKKLNKSGGWDDISLIDEMAGSGVRKFESKSDAEAYLKLYKDRLNKKLMVVHGRAKRQQKRIIKPF